MNWMAFWPTLIPLLGTLLDALLSNGAVMQWLGAHPTVLALLMTLNVALANALSPKKLGGPPTNINPKMILLALLPLLAGCATLASDLTHAKARADAAVKAGLLDKEDPLPLCLSTLIVSVQSLSPLGTRFHGVMDVGTDLYIIDHLTQAGSPELEKLCGPVAWRVLRNGVQRLPGL